MCLLAAALCVRSASAEPGATTITLPLDFTGSTPLLSVRVNGAPPGWFVVDSGAGACVRRAGCMLTVVLDNPPAPAPPR